MCVAWKGGTPSHTERSIVLDKNSVSWRRAEKIPWELSTWGELFGVRLCAMVSEGMWSPNRGFQGAAGGTGVWEEDGVRSESCQLSPRSLGSPRARHPRGDAPGRENPRALREPLAAPATASRRRHLGCAGEEEAPAEMDLNLEESLGRAFRDKLRLP